MWHNSTVLYQGHIGAAQSAPAYIMAESNMHTHTHTLTYAHTHILTHSLTHTSIRTLRGETATRKQPGLLQVRSHRAFLSFSCCRVVRNDYSYSMNNTAWGTEDSSHMCLQRVVYTRWLASWASHDGQNVQTNLTLNTLMWGLLELLFLFKVWLPNNSWQTHIRTHSMPQPIQSDAQFRIHVCNYATEATRSQH